MAPSALPRPFALMLTADQWCRAAHRDTAVERLGVGEGGIVRLAALPEPADEPGAEPAAPPTPAGLAFDPWCRLFHALPEAGRVERLLDPGRNPLAATPPPPAADLFAVSAPAPEGDFSPAAGAAPTPLAEPRALAIDDQGRLFVLEAGTASVLVVDLAEPRGRLLRRVRFPRPDGTGAYRPLDLATDGSRVWVALAGAPHLATIAAHGEPRAVELPEGVEPLTPFDRLALAPDGRPFLLLEAGTAGARIVPLDRPADAWTVPGATDLEFERGREEADARSVLVVARAPGRDLLRFEIPAPGTAPGFPAEPARAKARGYDGRGLVATPEGRIGFWAVDGAGSPDGTFRLAVPARTRFATAGRVVTYRLDAEAFQTRWGRLFVDACIPRGTSVRVHCATADEPDPDEPTIPRTPPSGGCPIPAARLLGTSPPMPPGSLAPAGDGDFRPLHRRERGREIPWAPLPAGGFATYEAPIAAPAGRSLWITLELRGDGRTTPRVASLRAEKPGHELLRRLPKTLSRDAGAADFLRRYLAPLDGALADLDARSTLRRALLDPWSTPAELLPWLASFLGLALDDRWSIAARRRLVAEAPWLFRFRGTVPGLTRMLEIVLGRAPILVEHFRVRGLGGAVVGDAGDLASRAVLGGGLRVGGAVGTDAETAVAGSTPPADAFATHAHRFTVVIPARLSPDELAAVTFLLDEHRPAHTLFELCTTDAGLRAGVGLYVGLSSVVGRGESWGALELDRSQLGRADLLGRPAPGIRPSATRLGADSVTG